MHWLKPVLAYLFILICSAHIGYAQVAEVDSLLLQRGLQAMKDGDYDEAESVFEKVLEIDSLHAEAHAMLARTYDALGRRIPAANHARLAVRHDSENIDYLILRHQIGFINPRPLDRARKRLLLSKILELDPDNAYANRERGREYALVYLHHRDRVQVTDFIPVTTPSDPDQNIAMPDLAPIQVRDPFDRELLESQGFTVIPMDMRAVEAYPEAVSYLTRALQTDPADRQAYDLLMALYAASEDADAMYRWAKTMKSFLPDDPYSYLYHGYAMYKMGNHEEADQSFKQALSLLNDNDLYVFSDITRIMNKEQKKEFDSRDISEIDRYWAVRDPRYISSYNERQIEHYARLVYAYLLFSEPKLDLKGWDSERGEIYVRYGAPEEMYYMTNSVENCDSGRSNFASGVGVNNITNFHVFNYEDYRFVFGNPGNIGDVANQTSAANVAVPPLNEFPLYSPCAVFYSSRASLNTDMDYVLRSKSAIRERPTSYELPGNVVEFPFLATAFRGEAGRSEVLVSYGFPVAGHSRQRGITGEGKVNLNLDTGAFLIEESTGVHAQSRQRVSSIFMDEILTFEEAAMWPGLHFLSAGPGSYILSVEFQRETDNAIGSEQEDIDVPDFSIPALSMSDILLAYFVKEKDDSSTNIAPSGTFVRNQLEIHPAPWALYEKGQSVYFYFEIYNLEQAAGSLTRYQVEAVLINEEQARRRRRRLFRRRLGKEEGVAVRFEGTAETTSLGQYLIMDTEEVQPGNYVLIVQITDSENGARVEKRRTMYLR